MLLFYYQCLTSQEQISRTPGMQQGYHFERNIERELNRTALSTW